LKKIYQKIWDHARPHLNTRANDIHTLSAIEFAYRLLDKEGGREAVVIPAVILHDVGWKKVPEHLQLKAFGPNGSSKWNRVHEVEGVKTAKDILENVHYDPALIPEILDIIDGHDSRKHGISLNDRIVKDADKLTRYTKEIIHINMKRFNHSFEQFTGWLGENLDQWMLTDAAREMARQELENRFKEAGNDFPSPRMRGKAGGEK